MKTLKQLIEQAKPVSKVSGILGIALIVLAFLVVILSPLCLYLGLKWMGFPVELSWKTYFGCLMILAFIRLGIGKSNKS